MFYLTLLLITVIVKGVRVRLLSYTGCCRKCVHVFTENVCLWRDWN